jgi:hypothetical protein
VCVAGVLCLPILLLLAPNIEIGRTEARLTEAYSVVRKLHSTINEAPTSITELADRDPWGEPYRAMPLKNGTCRVVSSGPDMSLSPDGIGGDDIYSDLPTSPMAPFRARRNRQWLIAFTVAIAAWALMATLYIRFRRASAN